MRTDIFPIVLAVIALGGAVISSPSAPAPNIAVPIDLVGLHEQAASALQTLRILQERRIALQQTNKAAF